MTEHEGWQVSGDAAEVYEKCFVPAIFGRWASPLVDAAKVASGDRVLDVGCGTGVLARAAADRVAAESQVTGLDLNEGMLAVARRLRPKIDWRQGDATKLPFADESYDVVVSQFSLMYFPDRIAALKEMWRVLRPGGRLAIAVWGPFERATSYVLLTQITKRRWGDAATEVLTAPFVLGEVFRKGHTSGTYKVKADCTGTLTYERTRYDVFIAPDGSEFTFVLIKPKAEVTSGFEPRATAKRVGP
jgi:SAM-dependent methyltransferase